VSKDHPVQGADVSPDRSRPLGWPGSRRPRWVINLQALLGVFASAIGGSLVVPWYDVYGSWAGEGDLGVLVYPVVGVGIGVGVWLIAWTVTFLGPRRVWITILAVSVVTPALVVNVRAFRDARERVCDIRMSNGHDGRLHDVPWPLALDCPYRT